MAKVRRNSKMRKFKAKKKTLSKATTKAVKSIVKRQIASTVETKFFQYDNGNITPNNYTFQSYNLFYHGVNQGTGDNAFLGDSVIWRGLKVNYQITNIVPGSVINDQPFQCKFMIISTPVYKAVANLDINDVRDNTTSAAGRFFYRHDAKVHFTRVVTFETDRYYPTGAQSSLKTKTGSIWFRRNQKIQYKNYAVDYDLRDRNYYLVVFMMSPTDISGKVATVSMTYKNYFKDP